MPNSRYAWELRKPSSRVSALATIFETCLLQKFNGLVALHLALPHCLQALIGRFLFGMRGSKNLVEIFLNPLAVSLQLSGKKRPSPGSSLNGPAANGPDRPPATDGSGDPARPATGSLSGAGNHKLPSVPGHRMRGAVSVRPASTEPFLSGGSATQDHVLPRIS